MASVIINGVTYADCPAVEIPKQGGGTARFHDTSDADAAGAEVLAGKTFYNSTGSASGSMANNGATGGTISTKAGTVTIPAGYTTGGTVAISSTEQAKIIVVKRIATMPFFSPIEASFLHMILI